MWRDYSWGYIKKNRSSGVSILIAVFISALLLSLLCGLFYNAWKYEIERIEREEGSWQSRLTGEWNPEKAATINHFANVEKIVINEVETNHGFMTVDIYFNDMRNVLPDTPRIAESLNLPPEAITYHYSLLAMYLIRSPQDTAPRLLFPMFLIIMLLASGSLIVIIHNVFAVSMHARIHQLGILSSIGATPKQIRVCLLQEAAALCAPPILAGNVLGICISRGMIQMVNVLLGNDVPGRQNAVFAYHPLVFLLTLLLTLITVWISAWLPARKLSRLNPIEAIKNTGELQLKRKKKFSLLALFFGVEGELAGNAIRAQRKAFRTATLSFICSFLAFTLMQCFFTLSGISTKETYFERYQDMWDIMITVKDTDVDSFEETKEIQGISGVDNSIVYQKAMAKRMVTEEEMSEEMKELGGFSAASDEYVTNTDADWMINAPIVIMDDSSFLAYCEQAGISPRLDGAVIRNQIRDVTNPDFRHPKYVPYVKETQNTSRLVSSVDENVTVEIDVLSYTEEVPVLREEYASTDYYELVYFLPVSLWKKMKEQIGGCEENTYIRILGKENASLTELWDLQNEVVGLISQKYDVESENRIQEYEINEKQIRGMKMILGGFCVLLAIIGVGNVFTNTLGFVRQRKREFARYISIGMTPSEMKKMFCIEALVIAGCPILFAFPLAILTIWYMLKMSYVEIKLFLAEAPFLSIVLFMMAILATVALAYSLSWRKVREMNAAEILRDDTMM